MIPTCVVVGLTYVASKYFGKAAEKMAENDFKNIGFVNVFSKSIKGMQWILRIGKHLGSLTKKPLDDLRFRNANKEIGIPNNAGEYLYVPTVYLKFYEEVPVHLLKNCGRM